MERTEPTCVPEWLRSNSIVTAGRNSAHNFASSSSHSVLDRSSSLGSRRSSSNGSAKHAYSSFSRSHYDKVRDKDKVRLNFGDHRDSAASKTLESLLTDRAEIATLHHSNSMFSRKHGVPFPIKVGVNARDSINSIHNNDNGLLSGVLLGVSYTRLCLREIFPHLGLKIGKCCLR
ncbi:hypothetical protein V6N13_059502 [Hibiscus sabdariffa]